MMIDSWVLLTPILMLPVAAFLAFVGCDWVLGLDRDEARKPVVNALVGAAGYERIELAWSPDRAAGRFEVKRKGPVGDYVPVDELPANEVTYTDRDVSPGATYSYVVTAFGGEEGPYESDEMSVRMPDTWITGSTLGTPRNAFTAWLGIAIRVGTSPVTVIGLGRAFAPGNNGTHQLKIVTPAGADVPGSLVTVSMDEPAFEEMEGQFCYAPLSGGGVVLASGATYYLVSQETMGQDLFYDNDTRILYTSVGVATASIFGNGAAFSTDGPAGQTYGPVNFRY